MSPVAVLAGPGVTLGRVEGGKLQVITEEVCDVPGDIFEAIEALKPIKPPIEDPFMKIWAEKGP